MATFEDDVFTIKFPFKGENVPLGISIAMRVHNIDGKMLKFAVVSANPQHYNCTVGDVIIGVDNILIDKSNNNPLKTLSALIKDKRSMKEDVVLSFRRGFGSTLSTPPPKKTKRRLSLNQHHHQNKENHNDINTNLEKGFNKIINSDTIDTSEIDAEMKLQIQETKNRYMERFKNDLDTILVQYEKRLRILFPASQSNQINKKICDMILSIDCLKNDKLDEIKTQPIENKILFKEQPIYQKEDTNQNNSSLKKNPTIQTNTIDSSAMNMDEAFFSNTQLFLFVGGIFTFGFYMSRPLKAIFNNR